MRRIGISVIAIVLATAVNGFSQEQDYKSFIGKTPPELTNKDATWLGPHAGRRKLSELKGNAVVWLEFGFLH